ncbi:MAG: hypothetical protein HOV68_25495 [Streptomycetaceae bacterium]|nr:hypothetical protein [Streptomycetaceae bacterium]
MTEGPGNALRRSAVIRFRFELRPLTEVEPWSDTPVNWFALTEGRYAIDVGGTQVLHWVDYYVARLWEDVLTLLPSAMEPVPDDLTVLLAHEPPDGWLSACSDADQDAITAALWCGGHVLDLSYLTEPPRLRFWRTTDANGDLTTIAGARPVTVSTDEFVAAVGDLHDELMDAMRDRIAESAAADHRDRAARVRRAQADRPVTDWASVRRGAGTLLATRSAQ